VSDEALTPEPGNGLDGTSARGRRRETVEDLHRHNLSSARTPDTLPAGAEAVQQL
jgi:hypothetical protein